jgi:hypothetical protein
MTTTPESAPAPKRAKKAGRWQRRAVWAVVIVVIGTFLARIFLPLLLPAVLRRVAGSFGMTCSYNRLELNLLSGDAGIWELEFRPKEGGDAILAADYCHGNLSVLKLLRGRLDIWRVEADGVEINIERTAEGRIPLLDRFVAGPSAAPATAVAPSTVARSIDLTSPLRVDALRLQHVRVHLHDQSIKPALDTVLAMDLRLSDLGSPNRPAKFELNLSDDPLLDSLVITGEGRSGGKTLNANMHLIARGVRLKPAIAYLQPLGIHPVADGLTFLADGQVHTAAAPNNGDGFSGSIVLDHISATADLKEALALDRFELDADSIDTKSIHLKRLMLDGVRAHGERADNGKLRLAGVEWDPWLIARPTNPSTLAPVAAQMGQISFLADLLAEPWSLDQLSVRKLNATFHDSTTNPAIDLSLVSDELSIRNINHDPGNLGATVTFAGELQSPRLIQHIKLAASAQPFAVKKTFQLSVDASEIRPDALKPYLDELGLESQFHSGRFTCDVGGWIAFAESGELQGDVNVDKVSLRDGTDLLTFKGINATGLGLDPATGRIHAGDIELSGPGILAHREANGSLACLGLRTKSIGSLLQQADAIAASPPSSASSAAITLPRIKIGRFAWKDIHFGFTDDAVSPATKLGISDAGVEITNFSTDAAASTQPARQGHLRAWFSAPGIAENLSVEGDVSPATEPGAVGVSFDVKAQGKAVTAAAVAPYLKPLGIEPTLTDGNLQLHAKAALIQSGDGLTGSLAVDNVRFADGATELAAVDQLNVNGVSVHPGEISVESIDIDHPRSAVTRDVDQSLMAAGVRLRLAANPPSFDTPFIRLPFAAVLKKLTVREVSLALTDRTVQPTMQTIASANIDLDHLTLGRAAPPAALKLTAKATGIIDSFSVIGSLITAPEHEAADLDITGAGLQAGPLAAYLPSGINVALTDGRFHTKVDTDLSLSPKGGYQAKLLVDGLDYRDGADGPPLLSLDSVKIVAPRIDLPYKALAIDEISVAGFETSAQLTPEGTIKCLGMVLGGRPREGIPSAIPTKAAPATIAPGPMMSAADLVAAAHRALPLVTVAKLDVGVRRLSLSDASRPTAAPVVVSDLHLKNVEPIEWLGKDADSKPPTKLQLTCRIDPLVDHVTLDALVSPFARQPGIQVDVMASGVRGNGLTALVPEIKPQVDGTPLTDGRFSAHLESLVKLDRRSPLDFDLSHGMDLDFLVKNVEYRASPDGPVLAGLEEIQSDGIRIEPANSFVHLKTLEITKPIAFFTLDNAGIHILGWVVKLPPLMSSTTHPATQPVVVAAAHDKAPAVPTKPKGELRIDRLLISGLDGRFEDRASNPPLIVPLNGLDVEVRDISTLAFYEDRPIRFSAIVNAAKVRLPKRPEGIAGGGARQWEERDLFAQITANGKISFYPGLNGWAKTSVSGFELSSLEGVAKQFDVTLTQGTFDSEVDARFNPDGSIDTDAHFRTTDLSLSEPSNGPIERILGLNAPLDIAIAAVQGADGGISIPVSLQIRGNHISMEDIFLAFPPAIGSVVATAIVSAPVKVVGAGFSVFGAGPDKKAAEQPVAITFAPGAVALDEAQRNSIAVLLKRLKEKPSLTLTIRHQLGGGDVELAMQRANPSPADCRDMEHQLLAHKAELLRLRADASGQARAQLMSLGETNSAETLDRLKAIDQELARTEDALDQVLELLRPGADRQAARRMRAVALDFGRERLDALKGVALVSRVPHIADRINVIDPQFNPTDDKTGGQLVIAVVEKKE